MAATNFWELERGNRRETATLIAVFITILAALGFGLDFIAGDVRIAPSGIQGFPLLTLAALTLGSVQSMVSYWGGASLVLASVQARELKPDSPRHQMVLDVISEMATAARMPAIKPYVMSDPAPNAFATGRDP